MVEMEEQANVSVLVWSKLFSRVRLVRVLELWGGPKFGGAFPRLRSRMGTDGEMEDDLRSFRRGISSLTRAGVESMVLDLRFILDFFHILRFVLSQEFF